MGKFKIKYRNESNRLSGFDYAANEKYFVTFCTKNRVPYLGKLDALVVRSHNYSTVLSEIGKMANEYWLDIPNHFPFVILDEFVIMPDHMHGILIFNNPEKKTWTPNKFGPQSQNLGSVLRGFKASLKRYANQNNIPFQWQSNYHDHIIRNDGELERIRNYIKMNPANWVKNIRCGCRIGHCCCCCCCRGG